MRGSLKRFRGNALSNGITYRLAREDDLSVMRVIQSTALRHLIVMREGKDPSAMPITDEPSSEMRHVIRTDPKLACLAIEDGRPIGFSVGFVRRELWFLSDLFVLPEAHGKGVGGELLQRCLAGGLECGARIRSVLSSGDPGAQALYIRAGMVPRFAMFGIEGPARGLGDLPRLRAQVKGTITQASLSKIWIRKLGDLDEMIWGRRRDGEHHFWLGESGLTCMAIADASGGLLAYAYYSSAASRAPWDRDPRRIGPVAARSARLQLALLRAIGDSVDGEAAGTVEFRIPGINMTALSALLATGFRIDHVGQFMTSRTFGRFDRYIPSGGTLL